MRHSSRGILPRGAKLLDPKCFEPVGEVEFLESCAAFNLSILRASYSFRCGLTFNSDGVSLENSEFRYFGCSVSEEWSWAYQFRSHCNALFLPSVTENYQNSDIFSISSSDFLHYVQDDVNIKPSFLCGHNLSNSNVSCSKYIFRICRLHLWLTPPVPGMSVSAFLKYGACDIEHWKSTADIHD